MWQISWTERIRRECAAAKSNLQSASTLCQLHLTSNLCYIFNPLSGTYKSTNSLSTAFDIKPLLYFQPLSGTYKSTNSLSRTWHQTKFSLLYFSFQLKYNICCNLPIQLYYEEIAGQFEFGRKPLSTDDGKWESRIWWLLPVLPSIDLEGPSKKWPVKEPITICYLLSTIRQSKPHPPLS